MATTYEIVPPPAHLPTAFVAPPRNLLAVKAVPAEPPRASPTAAQPGSKRSRPTEPTASSDPVALRAAAKAEAAAKREAGAAKKEQKEQKEQKEREDALAALGAAAEGRPTAKELGGLSYAQLKALSGPIAGTRQGSQSVLVQAVLDKLGTGSLADALQKARADTPSPTLALAPPFYRALSNTYPLPPPA
jgi:hypothetical protein